MLPQITLPSLAQKTLDSLGTDCADRCLDPAHFANYPHTVQYCFNSRGFRDQEWPDNKDDLEQAVWCVGDGFTLGIGVPLEHSWPWLLQQSLDRRCINVSMYGASNTWISRTAQAISQALPNATVIVHWTYIQRREMSVSDALTGKWDRFYQTVKDHNWPPCGYQQRDQLPQPIKSEIQHCHGWQDLVFDNDRIITHTSFSLEENLANHAHCVSVLPSQTIQSGQPNWVPKFATTDMGVITIAQLDTARDGRHYDCDTAQQLVSQLALAINSRS